MYTHSLDKDTIQRGEGELERIDRQLLKMTEHAQNILKEKLFLTGFSALGSFVNRFSALYPERVRAVAAGGINSLPILPLEQYKGESLSYPIGTHNRFEITGKEFQRESFKKVHHFLYMGESDDTLPCKDAWDNDERELLIKILPEDMKERWKECSEIYGEEAGIILYTYPEVGHTITMRCSEISMPFSVRQKGFDREIVPFL